MLQSRLFPSDNAPGPPASLDPLETPVEPETSSALWDDVPPRYALSDNFRHSGWQRHRRLIFDALRDLTDAGCRIEVSPGQRRRYVLLPSSVKHSRVEAFRTCGVGIWILQHREDATRFRVVPDHCRDRWCVPCANARRQVIQANLSRLLQDHPYRFLTLTIRHTDESLTHLIRKLYSGFRRLRQRQFWKDRVLAGVAFLEVTYNDERRSWHPHLHCVLDGSYLHRPDIMRAWLEVTGDSYNVDIRLIRNRGHVINYVSKYSTKPIPPAAIERPGVLREAIAALAGRRFLIQFGAWRNWQLLTMPHENEWALYCHGDGLEYRALDDDTLAANVLSMLATADPYTGEFVVTFDGDPPYP